MKELIDLLVANLKVDERQARGGAAILLQAARNKLGTQEFAALLGGVPGLDELTPLAPRPSGLGRLVGGLAGSLGGGRGALVASIVSGFARLGMTPGHARQMAPLMLDFVRAKAGAPTADRLEQSLRAGLA